MTLRAPAIGTAIVLLCALLATGCADTGTTPTSGPATGVNGTTGNVITMTPGSVLPSSGNVVTAAPPRAPSSTSVHVPATAAVPKLLVARTLLFRNRRESQDFGAFSYLLSRLPANADDSDAGLTRALRAYALVPGNCGFMTGALQPREINAFYVPLRLDFVQAAEDLFCDDESRGRTLALMTSAYDNERASVVLYHAGLDGSGPYLVAATRPLDVPLTPAERAQLLVVDLAGVPPSMIEAWIDSFVRSAARPGDWNTRSLTDWALDMRTRIMQLADGLRITREAVAATIKLPQAGGR